MNSAAEFNDDVVLSELSYLAPLPLYQTVKPYHISGQLNHVYPRTNLVFNLHQDIKFHDLRSRKTRLSLERDGFKYLDWDFLQDLKASPDALSVNGFLTEIRKRLEQWLPNTDGPTEKVICYSHRFRDGDNARTSDTEGELGTAAAPVNIPHADQTFNNGLNRVARHLTPEERLIYLDQDQDQYRIRIIKQVSTPSILKHRTDDCASTWTPLLPVISADPLAVCDYSTISLEHDLCAIDRIIIGSAYIGEVYYLKYNSNHKWWWLSQQKREETLVFVSWDSENAKVDVGAKFCAHASFRNPKASVNDPARQSVEARFIWITKKEAPMGH
ncbi:hypothetical protein DFH27DRAFT_610668 [Peziza echinospora]|nr:hypothetical protein DFH27DRAFT_610668 [Peziza echinospora]